VQNEKKYTESNQNPITYMDTVNIGKPMVRSLRNSDANLVSNLQKMRNPMYADFDYSHYNKNPVESTPKYQPPQNNLPTNSYSNSRPQLQEMDSLETFKNEYENLNKKSQSVLPINQKKFQTDWLNFYGTDVQNKPAKQTTFNLNTQEDSPGYSKPTEPSTGKITRKTEQDVHFKNNMANFYGDTASDQDKFAVNVDKFYGNTPEIQIQGKNSKVVRKEPQNIFQIGPKDIVTFNPLSQAPVVRYQSLPKRKEKVQINSVKEQWQYKNNMNKFFAI